MKEGFIKSNTRAKGTISYSDSYLSRLVKYIPSEVIALYLTIDPLMRSAPESDPVIYWIYWAVFAAGVIFTPLYLWTIQEVKKISQLVISTLAFAVWVFAIGGPFTTLHWQYQSLCAAILLSFFTFLIPIIEVLINKLKLHRIINKYSKE
jgi:hypothetical protein